MKPIPTNPTNGESSTDVVILHQRGDQIFALLATPMDSPGSATTRWSIKDTKVIGTEGTDELATWIESSDATETHVILPAAKTISRVLEIAIDSEVNADESLRLQAEAHLLGGVSAHRIGMALLPARGTAPRQGVLVTWPESAHIALPATSNEPFCLSESSALLAMLPATRNGVSIDGAPEALVAADRNTGSIAMVIDRGNAVIVRSIQEEPGDKNNWNELVGRSVAETLLAAHEEPKNIGALRDRVTTGLKNGDHVLVLPDAVRTHVAAQIDGTTDDSAWWQDWGLSVGALLAIGGPLHNLTTMRVRERQVSAGVLGELIQTFSRPTTVVALLVAAVFVVAAVPLVSAWLRLQIVESKIDNLTQLDAVLNTSEQQRALYSEVATRAWPMTKLLGDLANSMPLGIQADTITINEGDAVIIRGAAGEHKGTKPRELILAMLDRMEGIRVFRDISYKDDPINSSGVVEFSLNARVAEPFLAVRDFDHDFGKVSHTQLRYPYAFNEDGTSAYATPSADSNSEISTTPIGNTETTAPAPVVASANNAENEERSAPMGAGRENLAGSRVPSSSRRNGTSSPGGSSLRGTSGSASRRSESTGAISSGGPAPVPEAFTDTELAAMSRSEAKALLGQVAEAKLRKDLDDESAARLRADLYRILDHMKTIPADGGSGGSS